MDGCSRLSINHYKLTINGQHGGTTLLTNEISCILFSAVLLCIVGIFLVALGISLVVTILGD